MPKQKLFAPFHLYFRFSANMAKRCLKVDKNIIENQ